MIGKASKAIARTVFDLAPDPPRDRSSALACMEAPDASAPTAARNVLRSIDIGRLQIPAELHNTTRHPSGSS